MKYSCNRMELGAGFLVWPSRFMASPFFSEPRFKRDMTTGPFCCLKNEISRRCAAALPRGAGCAESTYRLLA